MRSGSFAAKDAEEIPTPAAEPPTAEEQPPSAAEIDIELQQELDGNLDRTIWPDETETASGLVVLQAATIDVN